MTQNKFVWLKNRLKNTGDSEPEQALIRLLIGLLLISFFCIPWGHNEHFTDILSSTINRIVSGYFVASILILVAILSNPVASPARRIVGIFLDLISLSFLMYAAPNETGFLFVFYLWVILGNGFRYGVKYFYISVAIGIVGFLTAILKGSYWQEYREISISLLILITLIPLYSAFLINKLHSAIDMAKKANESKSRFLANMSHELRTPLNGVIGMSDLLRETTLNREQRELVSTMQESAKTLLKLIEKVLDISKIEAGKIVITHENFDLYALINSVVSIQSLVGSTKGLHVFSNINSDVPYLVNGDQQHIKQVLVNLIGNAIKFTDQGSVNLHIYCVDDENDTITIRFEIRDTGIGIAEDYLSQVFDDFTQVGFSSERTDGGTGLGTTISKELVELMGGKIGVESELNQGSLFWFELPLTMVEQDELDISDNHILLLSNDEHTSIVGPILKSWNIQYDNAKTPSYALTLLKRAIKQGERYKTVLVDPIGLLDLTPIQFAELLEREGLLDDLSLVLINSTVTNTLDHDVEHYYVTVLESLTDKRLLFNALHAAETVNKHEDNIVSLSAYYAEKANGQVLNILVAEDNAVNRLVIEGILIHAGHTVTIVQSGDEALDILTNGTDFDLLIVDKNMPERSGDEVVQALRFMDTQHDMPVIMLTADATPEAKVKSMAVGVDAFLTKPIDSYALLDKIASLAANSCSARHRHEAIISEQKEKISAKLYDEKVFHQLVMLDNNMAFIRRLVKGFSDDGSKHIAIIKNAVNNDYLELRESLHALKGSATEMGASKLAEICISGESRKPHEIGSAQLIQLSQDIELVYKNTIAAFEEAISKLDQA